MSKSTGKDVRVRGRIVWAIGDLFKGKPSLDQNTKQPRMDKTGKQMVQYGFGLAVPKMLDGQPNQELQNFMNGCQAEALQVFTNGHVPPAFAYKYKDGDGIDDKGVPFNQRDGYAGHIVFALTSYVPCKFFKWEQGKNMMVNEGIKCGDYVDVNVSMSAHGAVGTGKPGMYLNPQGALLIGYGTPIISKAYDMDADSVFGSAAPAPFQGASQMPIAPQGVQFPQTSQPQYQQPQAPQPYNNVLPQHLQQPVPQPQYQQPAPQPQQPAPTPFPQGGFPFGQR
jgi:hypothetical protein